MLDVLNSLTIKGLAEVGDLAEATGRDAQEVSAQLAGWQERGLVRWRQGRLSGWSVTADGRSERDRQLAESVPTGAAAATLNSGYERFLPLNSRFKRLCTTWQTRPAPAVAVPRATPGPDAGPTSDAGPGDEQALIDELARLHTQIAALLGELATALPRLAPYQPRLDAALARLRAGDTTAFTAPRRASYHDVWMELHADLLATLGRNRSTADEA